MGTVEFCKRQSKLVMFGASFVVACGVMRVVVVHYDVPHLVYYPLTNRRRAPRINDQIESVVRIVSFDFEQIAKEDS